MLRYFLLSARPSHEVTTKVGKTERCAAGHLFLGRLVGGAAALARPPPTRPLATETWVTGGSVDTATASWLDQCAAHVLEEYLESLGKELIALIRRGFVGASDSPETLTLAVFNQARALNDFLPCSAICTRSTSRCVVSQLAVFTLRRTDLVRLCPSQASASKSCRG